MNTDITEESSGQSLKNSPIGQNWDNKIKNRIQVHRSRRSESETKVVRIGSLNTPIQEHGNTCIINLFRKLENRKTLER